MIRKQNNKIIHEMPCACNQNRAIPMMLRPTVTTTGAPVMVPQQPQQNTYFTEPYVSTKQYFKEVVRENYQDSKPQNLGLWWGR
jgi:hypothetical protein